MSKHRRAAKVDGNQAHIVATLKQIPGVSVAVDHDDILVGRNGRTYWYELKAPHAVSRRTGRVKGSALKDSQRELAANWRGHYRIVASLNEILAEIMGETRQETGLSASQSADLGKVGLG